MAMVEIVGCPIAATMGVLGRKWAMPIMRDVVMMDKARFSEFMHSNPGLTPRVLSRRLGDLVESGYLARHEGEHITYGATAKGAALAPVLQAIAEYGVQHNPEMVFADGRPRPLEEFLVA